MDIVIRIPQKFNISCCVSRGDLVVGGGQHNYDDNGKLEGDVHLRTLCGGNIVLHGKVRGHEVTLESLASSQVLPPPPLDPSTTEKVDDDDESAAIDIGSVYIVSVRMIIKLE